MKKITHSLVALFALIATTAFAVDPVAVWNGGNLNGTTQGGITLNLNGNTYSDDAITISGSKGVLLNNANANVCSVIIEYENFNTTANVTQTLFTLQKSGQDNNVGVYWNTSAKLHGIYSNNSWGNDYAANAIPASGRLCFGYNKGGNGVTVYAGDVTVYDANNLKEGGSTYTGVSIGGYRGTATIGAASNMKITAIAFFTSKLSASEVTAYKFPAPSKLYLYTQGTNGGWGGNCNYGNNLNGITLPATAEAPAGTKIEVTKMEIARSPSCDATQQANNEATYIAITVGNKTTKSAAKVEGGTIAASGGNNPVKLTYNFPVGCVLTVGTQATIKWLKADGSEITGQIRYAASNDATGRFLSVNNGNGYSPIALLYGREPIALTEKTIDADKTWTALWNGSEPKADEVVALTVSGNPTLTLDKSIACDSIILLGDGNLTIVGNSSADMAKIDCGSFTGKLTFEIDASAGLTADTALKNYIRTASEKTTFVFKGSGNNGATLDYGYAVNAAIHSHIAFVGGTHAMTYGYGDSGADGNCFGINANNDNPTVLVTDKATLNFTAKDFSYWNGEADMSGVIRVDDGATLNFLANGRNTIYYRQRLCLEPGAKVTFPNTTGQNDSKPVMRFLGGTAENKEVIYVLPPTGSATTATISGDIFLPKDETHGFGIFVSENSRLKWTGNVPVFDNNDDKAIVKRGAGVFEYYGTMDGVVQVLAGSIAGTGSFRKLTFNDSATLNLDNGAPTITGSLVTATEKQLKLAITSPVHGMSVITLPDAADKTGWTAYVNDRAEPNELTVDGNTLKLKWKIPPTIEVDIDDITIEPTSDWNGGTVKIDVSGLNKGDYKEDGDITYRLRFGDTTVAGEVEGNSAIFTLPDTDFTAGNIYRGTFELGYGDDTLKAADVIVYEGKLTYVEKDQWVNETPDTLGDTGSYDPESGVSVVEEKMMIQINTNKEVTFTPTPDPDYVDKCDSSFTIQISADEAIDDSDQTIEEGAQAGVQIVADDEIIGGVKFQFIVGDEWVNGPKAELNKLYEVTISFHYAKEEGDKDSVTYAVGEWKESYDRRENTANKVTEIIFYDGTQFASLVGTCEIESADPSADPVPQGLKPGEDTEIDADNDEDARKKAAKIPVLIPDDELVVAALDTDAKKDAYKALFKVVAVKKNGSYTAEVVFADDKISTIKDDEENILTEVVKALGSLLGEEGTLDDMKGQPGLYYGIATDGALVNMGEAQPGEWKIADKDGNIFGLKVKKTANAKQGFYKVICTPKPTKKDN